jgi:hypothetical protein
MAAIQIGKYKRPGIFFEEFDQSIIPNPVVPTLTIPPVLVVGFSKKGPINTPILLSSISDVERIYGPLDRNLERKGSFFHRTVAKMLESGPVLAMNLLSTNDTLDKIEYRSLSTSTNKNNGDLVEIPFRKVHDTSSFWKKDTTIFIDTVKNEVSGADRLFHITNLSNRYVSVFIFKSKLTGFNQPLLQYYGTADKVPAYVNQLDFASDYLVDVLIVGGDWSNYAELSVDIQWSAYFGTTGLRKTAVSAFAQDRNVNTLGFYEGCSLIPYFKDENNRNIFIETVINADTDRTGVFCAFNADKLEGEFPNGMVDIIGNNLAKNNSLVDVEQDEVNFLSYRETITEQNNYPNVYLDTAGGPNGQNVVGLPGGSLGAALTGEWQKFNTRTAYMKEGIIEGIIFGSTAASGRDTDGFTSSTNMVITFQAGTVSLGGNVEQPYFVSNGTMNLLDGGIDGPSFFTFSISSSDYSTDTVDRTYHNTFYLSPSTSTIEKATTTLASTFPTVSANDLVLGYASHTIQGTTSNTVVFKDHAFFGIGVTSSISASFDDGFVDLDSSDISVVDNGLSVITVTFNGTAATQDVTEYLTYRKIRLFNYLVSMLDSTNISKMAMLANVTDGTKISLANATVSEIKTSTSENKSFKLDLGTGLTTPTDIAAGKLVFYKLDNEFVIGALGFNSGNGTTASVASATIGIASKESAIYNDFYDGNINTGDYFYNDLNFNSTRVLFINDSLGQPNIVFGTSSTQPWIVSGTESFIIPSSSTNYKTFTIASGGTPSFIVDPSTGLSFSNAGNKAYILNKSVTDEDLGVVTRAWDPNDRRYIEMSLDSNDNMTATFKNSTLTGTQSAAPNGDFSLISDLTDLKETVEIHEPAGYTPIDNKVLIIGSRYPTLKTGDFLQAEVNEDPDVLLPGMIGRRLTRILNKKAWSVDPTYSEVTCDAAIKKYSVGSGMQTLKYTSIDTYVSTYKAIPLKGFRPRAASQPDGTEETQNSILNIVAKGTTLFKALVNKDAIDFRYVVDSFGLGLIENSKQQLMDICGDRLDCFGFLNMPSMRQFRNSANPSFLDANENLSTALIASGGDPEKNPRFLYSFGTGKGTTSTGYFLPYVIVNDNGRPAELPPAMFSATTYMRKFLQLTTSILPWTIAAGVTNGRILGIQGIEQNYSFNDIENLNLAQMNPIVFKRNRGFIIETENTAQTIYKSALSLIHVREVLIELERELGNMLLDFQWKFNTPDVRAEIKLKADVICETYVARNGLYNYFNKCDDENNPPDLIDRQIGVIDTYVEPIKGMGIIVNNITILRTGAIEAGGFL